MAGDMVERKHNSLTARVLEGVFIAVVAGVIVHIITTGRIPWPPAWVDELFDAPKESWVKIQHVQVTPSDADERYVAVDLDVRYSLGQKDSALLAVMCNYIQQDSFSSMGLDGEVIIDQGDGEYSFHVSFVVPEWDDDIAIRVYIYPYPLPDQWEPIAASEMIPLSVANSR